MTNRERIFEADKNKKWSQVRCSRLVDNDRSLPDFDNTNLWHGMSESPSWTTNGVRGQALPTPYYDGKEVNQYYTRPIDKLLVYIGFMKAATIEMNAGLAGALAGLTIAGSAAYYRKVIGDWILYEKMLDECIWSGLLDALTDPEDPEDLQRAIREVLVWLKEKGRKLAPPIIVASYVWLWTMGILAGNVYDDIYKAWNEFEQDSINCQHRADTEVDADGNPLWSGYQVVYNIDYGNTTTVMSSSSKLIQNKQLKRGRYRTSTYGRHSMLYTFKYTKTITMIPA